MESLSVRQLLLGWERGLGEGPVERALTLCQVLCPQTPRDTLARLSIGRRDASLLRIRERAFGPTMVSLVKCPRCEEVTELAFDVNEVRARSPAEDVEEATFEVDGYDLKFRLPSSADVAALASEDEPARSRRLLFERCLLDACRGGAAIASEDVPAHVVDAVSEQMGKLDPQADVQIETCCPSCGQTWKSDLDIASFLWAEVDAWARRVLGEVHILASRYHWSENEILALSPPRRQLYLDMVSQ